MPKQKSDFEFRRWGTEFKNGKLYNFSDKHVVVMAAWPDVRAWIKRKSHGWQATRIWADRVISHTIRTRRPADCLEENTPMPPLLPPEDMPSESERDKNRRLWFEKRSKIEADHINKYMDQVPPEIRQMVGSYGDRNWQVMNLFARCPGLEDLHQSNPALVLALANSWAFQKEPLKRPMRAARSLIFRKQKDILRWLGFPPTEHVRKILAKIPAECLELKGLLYLRHWLKDKRVLKYLSHLDRINEAVISMVTAQWNLAAVTPQLLSEVSRIEGKDQSRTVNYEFCDAVRMGNRLNWRNVPRSFLSIARMKDVHDQLVQDYNRHRDENWKNLPEKFPDPPYRGTANIWPIMTPDDLYHEGCEQRNCVASRAYSVAAGGEYIYRIYHPVRATLSVRKGASGWEVTELLAACNMDVPEDVRESLTAALYSSGQYVAPVEKVLVEEEAIEIFDDAQLPLGMTPEAMALIARVESCFGRSQKIEMALPAERMSA